ncbi:MAG: hypothetical protein Q8J68_14585 [Methanolobus sp.]|nr:hypothetical protein [Methanolobus sp.]MDP2218501.1 hypothetical protein [Methanolobus sp.]
MVSFNELNRRYERMMDKIWDDVRDEREYNDWIKELEEEMEDENT